MVFMHPQGAENVLQKDALKGKGDLGNIIGNPLETTIFLTRMMVNGTFDLRPQLENLRGARGDTCHPTSGGPKSPARCAPTPIARTRSSRANI